MNNYQLSGYLGIDPKITVTQSGKKKAAFTVANRIAKDKTQFVYVTAWEKTAELMENYAHKGTFVIVEGRISVFERTTQTGERTSQIQLVADRVELHNSKKDEPQQKAPTYTYPKEQQKPVEIDPNDLPF